MKKLFHIIFLLSTFNASSQVISSNLISTDGGSFYQLNAKMDWAIGETVIETYKANNNYLTQGFIQGANNSLNNVKEKQGTNISVNLFPNPFINTIQIEFTGLFNTQKLSIVVYDILGKEVFYKDNLNLNNSIDLGNLYAGLYLVNIKINDQNYRNFRIEKLD